MQDRVPSFVDDEGAMDDKSRGRRSKARPLLTAGAGIAVAVMTGCGSSDEPIVVGNLVPVPACDAGVCLPDGGRPEAASCYCPVDGGADGGS
jgi:hypothetical protein